VFVDAAMNVGVLGFGALILAAFAVFWFAGRGTKPKADGQKENAKEVFSERW